MEGLALDFLAWRGSPTPPMARPKVSLFGRGQETRAERVVLIDSFVDAATALRISTKIQTSASTLAPSP